MGFIVGILVLRPLKGGGCIKHASTLGVDFRVSGLGFSGF